MFADKTLLITGGTGSFGTAVLDRFIHTNFNEIRILSRDEKKQDDMRAKYQNSRLKFYLGDVRDPQSINPAVDGSNYIFHAAALKQVPSCEFHPLEAVKTNVLGTENLLTAAVTCGVEKVVVLSTDKAVYPINAMGISKALMEKVAIAKSRSSTHTTITVTRYGNVMASRGSVIPLFTKQILDGLPLTITDPNMTRFMMSLDDAVDLVVHAFKCGVNGDILVQKSPGTTIMTLAQTLCHLLNQPNHPIKIIGTRHGEKLHEFLLSREELSRAIETDQYFRVPPDLRDLNYEQYVETGEINISTSLDFSSCNTQMLDQSSLSLHLSRLPYLKQYLTSIQ